MINRPVARVLLTHRVACAPFDGPLARATARTGAPCRNPKKNRGLEAPGRRSSTARAISRRAALDVPYFHGAVRLLHVDDQPGVRVHPAELLDRAFELDGLIRVELRRKRVMREHRSGG